MPAMTTIATIWLGCAAIIPGCTAAAITPEQETPARSPIEHVVYDGDEGNIGNITPPDTITVRFPGADGYDDAYYRARCADMGGDFGTREFGTEFPQDGTEQVRHVEAVCVDVDY